MNSSGETLLFKDSWEGEAHDIRSELYPGKSSQLAYTQSQSHEHRRIMTVSAFEG